MASEPPAQVAPVAEEAGQESEGDLVLIDKSAWEKRAQSAVAKERIDRLAASGRAATCLPVALEQLYSARNFDDLADRRGALDLLVWLPMTAAVEDRAIEVMAQMARKGQHRLPLPDIMIAATALVHGAKILHHDRHFERIAETTGLAHEWVLPRGTGRDGGTQSPE